MKRMSNKVTREVHYGKLQICFYAQVPRVARNTDEYYSGDKVLSRVVLNKKLWNFKYIYL